MRKISNRRSRGRVFKYENKESSELEAREKSLKKEGEIKSVQHADRSAKKGLRIETLDIASKRSFLGTGGAGGDERKEQETVGGNRSWC